MLYAVDIDNTITVPQWFDKDLHTTIEHYVRAGIITREQVGSPRRHPHFYLLPQIAVTHLPWNGAVEVLQGLAAEGSIVQYITLRNHIEPEICHLIHENTHLWLERHHFPNPHQVQFFWDYPDKFEAILTKTEDQAVLIDDQPVGLLDGYTRIAASDPQKAQQIRDRITLVAFGYQDTHQLSLVEGLRVVPLADWFQWANVFPILGNVHR